MSRDTAVTRSRRGPSHDRGRGSARRLLLCFNPSSRSRWIQNVGHTHITSLFSHHRDMKMFRFQDKMCHDKTWAQVQDQGRS